MKEKIDIHNYGAFIIDYYDGVLAADEVERLMLFLSVHPAAKEEFTQYEHPFTLPKEDTIFNGKQGLMRSAIHEQNEATWLVAALENDLDADQQIALSNYLNANEGAQALSEKLAQTKLVPELQIVMEGKHHLKRKARVFDISTTRIGIAAIAALILLFFIFIKPQEPLPTVAKQAAIDSLLTPTAQQPIPLPQTATQMQKVVQKPIATVKLKPIKKNSITVIQQELITLQPKDTVMPLVPLGPNIGSAKNTLAHHVDYDGAGIDLAELEAIKKESQEVNSNTALNRTLRQGAQVLEKTTGWKVDATENHHADKRVFAINLGKKFSVKKTNYK